MILEVSYAVEKGKISQEEIPQQQVHERISGLQQSPITSSVSKRLLVNTNVRTTKLLVEFLNV